MMMDTTKLEEIYAANDTFFTKGEKGADYRALMALLKAAPKVQKRDLTTATNAFAKNPSSANFRALTAYMLVYQHQN